MRLSFPASGDEMPNILLSLSILNENGDADLYCMPEFLFTEGVSSEEGFLIVRYLLPEFFSAGKECRWFACRSGEKYLLSLEVGDSV